MIHVPQYADRLDYRIFFIHRQIGAVQAQARRIGTVHLQHIIKINRDHDHPEIVITVLPPLDNIQAEIDFRIRTLFHNDSR